tara:strand:+ start:673 stop:924 length:252 start_codon:yes stop_codon:yes gene_type:complete
VAVLALPPFPLFEQAIKLRKMASDGGKWQTAATGRRRQMADGGNGRWLGQNQSENDLCSIQADDWSVNKRKKTNKNNKSARKK